MAQWLVLIERLKGVRTIKKINIKGAIISSDDQWIYDLFGIEATSPKSVEEQMGKANDDEELEVIINSGGGSVFDGSEIYTSLKSHPGNVTVKIVGIAASAASVIAMAGNRVQASPTSQIMIHNASGVTAGDHRDMDHMSKVLKNVNQSIASAYKIKTGKSDDELLQMMSAETWFTPEQALENKFIDEIMFQQELQLTASSNYSNVLPKQVLDKIRNEKIIEPPKRSPTGNTGEDFLYLQNLRKKKLNLMEVL